MTQVPFLQVLYLVYGLLNRKPCLTAPFSGIFRDSVQVDAAETDLRRVLRGAGAPSGTLAGNTNTGWRVRCSAAVAAGKTQVDICIRALVMSRRSAGATETRLGHATRSLPLLCNTERKVWNPNNSTFLWILWSSQAKLAAQTFQNKRFGSTQVNLKGITGQG